MDKTENYSEPPKQPANVGVFDSNNMQCLVIVKRLKSLVMTLRILAEEPRRRRDILNTSFNNKTKLWISSFWSCHTHSSCADCKICCSCVMKMYIEMHLLSERDNVGDNYVAVSNIINGLMRKLAYQNEIQKKRKEAEENRNKRRENGGKIESLAMTPEEIINWPDDLTELISNWDNLPENQNKNMMKSITTSDGEHLLRTVMEPIPPQPIHSSQVMRAWPIHRQAMIARPIISQINNRGFINRTVIPRPILTHPISPGGRPLMSHIVSSGRHHIMSHIVAGRPILSRVISSNSLMGHMVAAQSLMNHSSTGNRNMMHSNTSGSQLLQNHLPRQLNHNLTFVNYNPSLHSRSSDHHSIISHKKNN